MGSELDLGHAGQQVGRRDPDQGSKVFHPLGRRQLASSGYSVPPGTCRASRARLGSPPAALLAAAEAAIMKIGVLGSGVVGETLANGFLKHGHEVTRGSRDPAKLAGWKAGAGPKAGAGTMVEAARFGELVVLAVKGTAAVATAEACAAALAGKAVIDTSNPIAEEPPVHGVLRFFTTLDASLLEELQRRVPRAHFVKAFSCVGAALMVDPELPGGKPSMFICGNDDGAKQQVAGLLAELGWETEDAGRAEAARAIEPLCMLWCIPGFLRNDWVHAFKVLRR
jgi:predicted dinucleotide-binding enzyme